MLVLNADNLGSLPAVVGIPRYNRADINTGIVHIGVGNFHRAHQAWYIDRILHRKTDNWGICGIGLLDRDSKMYEILKNQDYLYTLMIREENGNLKTRIIGSIIDYIFAPEDPEKAIEQLADPEVKIISLTITEGGYNMDDSTGSFDFSDPAIQHDLDESHTPITVFGYLARALSRRKKHGNPGLTILSCDNILKNGDTCRKMFLAFIEKYDPRLSQWIQANVSFPNSMVDRITPATTQGDIEALTDAFGYRDDWPVVCEPFSQWVIEDHFVEGRPEWERTKVQFVDEVEPYEKMKIRLLNAGHTLLGMTGTLAGYDYIDEVVNDPVYRWLLQKFMDEEVTPVLGRIKGIDIEEYKKQLLKRFGNTHMRDSLSRICSESSAKIPKFLLPTIREQFERGGSIKFGTFVVAAWCRYLGLAGTSGHNYQVNDIMEEVLIERAGVSENKEPGYFIELRSIFGHLSDNQYFKNIFVSMLRELKRSGIKTAVKKLCEA